MKKIYSILTTQILQVQGNFEYLGEENGKAFVKGEGLNEPFKEDTLPQSLQELLEAPLKEAKEQKIKELNALCEGKLINFRSSALGEVHIYDGDLEDQINLMGAVAANADMPFRCRKDDGISSKENILHTKAQLKKVYSDGIAYKADVIYRCGVLKNYVEKLNEVEEVQSISWESYEDVIEALNA